MSIVLALTPTATVSPSTKMIHCERLLVPSRHAFHRVVVPLLDILASTNQVATGGIDQHEERRLRIGRRKLLKNSSSKHGRTGRGGRDSSGDSAGNIHQRQRKMLCRDVRRKIDLREAAGLVTSN